ncbi:hypothetical protein OG280_40890 (plasmid) [Streptomyces virginiae]
MGRKKTHKPKPAKQLSPNPKTDQYTRLLASTDSIARLALGTPLPPASPKPAKRKKPNAKAINVARRKQAQRLRDTRLEAQQAVRDARLDAALKDYEQPIPAEVARHINAIIKENPPAPELPPRRRR